MVKKKNEEKKPAANIIVQRWSNANLRHASFYNTWDFCWLHVFLSTGMSQSDAFWFSHASTGQGLGKLEDFLKNKAWISPQYELNTFCSWAPKTRSRLRITLNSALCCLWNATTIRVVNGLAKLRIPLFELKFNNHFWFSLQYKETLMKACL